jgi:segregation and condensation protein B
MWFTFDAVLGDAASLLDRGLVRMIGKKEEAGRPILYGTTPEFLRIFSLRDLAGAQPVLVGGEPHVDVPRVGLHARGCGAQDWSSVR